MKPYRRRQCPLWLGKPILVLGGGYAVMHLTH
jgi:hypothetical protein